MRLPILSKRPEIRIPAWRQLSKRRFSTRCLPKPAILCQSMRSRAASDSLKETRDKDSSLAAVSQNGGFAKAVCRLAWLKILAEGLGS